MLLQRRKGMGHPGVPPQPRTCTLWAPNDSGPSRLSELALDFGARIRVPVMSHTQVRSMIRPSCMMIRCSARSRIRGSWVANTTVRP